MKKSDWSVEKDLYGRKRLSQMYCFYTNSQKNGLKDID